MHICAQSDSSIQIQGPNRNTRLYHKRVVYTYATYTLYHLLICMYYPQFHCLLNPSYPFQTKI